MYPIEDNFAKLKTVRPNSVSIEDLERELDLESHNVMLFASKKVLRSLNEFRIDKSEANWSTTLRAK
jgi:hypothetical protein